MGETVRMTLGVELAWIVLEVTSMALFGACYTIQAKRLRLARSPQRNPGPMASVVCIDRH